MAQTGIETGLSRREDPEGQVRSRATGIGRSGRTIAAIASVLLE